MTISADLVPGTDFGFGTETLDDTIETFDTGICTFEDNGTVLSLFSMI